MPSRFLFPEDRTAFVYQGPNMPILTPPRTALVIYTTEAATTLADIQTTSGFAIEGSVLYTGEDGLLPEFSGPPGAVRVWAKVMGAGVAAYPLLAQYSELLASRPELETSLGRPLADQGVEGSWCIDRVNYVLYGPKTPFEWPPTGIALAADPRSSQKPTSHVHLQISADKRWVMDHPLDFKPSVTILDSFGEEVEGDLMYPSVNRVVAIFAAPFSGTAIMS